MSRARIIMSTLVVGGALMASSSPAQAAGYDCDSSALRASILGGNLIEPLVANRGIGTCLNVNKTLAELPKELPLLGAELAMATTSITDGALRTQRVLSTGGLAHVKVKALPELPIALPTPQIADSLQAVNVPLAAPLSTLLGTNNITVDLKPAIEALLPNGRLPNVDLVEATVATAYASAGCLDGRAQLAGASQIAGIKVLGQELPVDALIEQAIQLVDTSNIDLDKIDLTKVVMPKGLSLTTPGIGPLLQAAIKPILHGLPDIQIPATVGLVKITPNEQIRSGNRLTQRALHVEVGLLGRSLVDVVLGEASVSENAVDCAEPLTALSCTKKRLVLTDVIPAGDRVKLIGVADKALVGKTVNIVFRATEKVVAKAVVQPDGSFKSTAAMPSRAVRNTNDARYQARIGREESLDLKLMRRMVVDSMTAKNGQVMIAGHLTGPLTKPLADVIVTRRISCKKSETVATLKPRQDGTFEVLVPAPAGISATVYRLESKVLKVKTNPKAFDTYTLPRGVNLLG